MKSLNKNLSTLLINKLITYINLINRLLTTQVDLIINVIN